MAQIRLDLSQFKASGVYTLEYDMSENIVLNTQTVRLIVGFSRKGPFNAPVFLPDKKTAKQVFGDVDTFLERRGSFFHRSLFTALEVGPVFGLNLLALNNEGENADKVPYQSFSVATTERNGKKLWKLFASYFNKERFWYPDQEYLLANVNTPGSINQGKILNVVNLSQTPLSIIIKKSTDVRQFDITAREFFGAGKVPTYIDEYDYISDYFVDVVVLQGNWTNYSQFNVDPIFNSYFDLNGVKKNKLREFLNLTEVTHLGSFTGSIIPELRDANGTNYSIDTIINSTLASIGLFISIDRDALENYDPYNNLDDDDIYSAVDMVGHNIGSSMDVIDIEGDEATRTTPDMINFLSYKFGIKDEYIFDIEDEFTSPIIIDDDLLNTFGRNWKTESLHLGRKYGYFNNILAIPKPIDDSPYNAELDKYNELKNLLIPGDSLLKLDNSGVYKGFSDTEDHYGVITQIYEENDLTGMTWLKLLWSHPQKQDENLVFTEGNNMSSIRKVTGADLSALSYTQFSGIDDSLELLEINLTSPLATVPLPGTDIMIKDINSGVYYYGKVFKTSANLPQKDGTQQYFGTFGTSGTAGEFGIFNTDGLFDEAVGGVVPTVTDFDYHESDVYLSLSTADKIYIEYDPAIEALGETFVGVTGALNNFKLYYKFSVYPQIPSFADDVATGLGLVLVDGTQPNFVPKPDIFNFAFEDTPTIQSPNYFYAYKYSRVYDYWAEGVIKKGDKLKDDGRDYYIDFLKTINSDGHEVVKVYFYDTATSEIKSDGTINKLVLGYNSTFPAYDEDLSFMAEVLIEPNSVTTGGKSLWSGLEIISNSWNSDKTSFDINLDMTSLVDVNDFIVSKIINEDGSHRYKLSKIVKKSKKYSPITGKYVVEITINQPAFMSYDTSTQKWSVRKVTPIDNYALNYQFFYLDGFKLNEYHLPGGRNKALQLERILGVLDPVNSNLMEVLSDRDLISFRYIVDTFDGGLAPMTYPKTYLTKLAKSRQKCLALMNAPSIKEFKESNDPRFTKLPTPVDPKPILDSFYIALGGNLDLNPAYTFSLPDEFNGSKFAGYFSPFLTIRENNRNINIPPAAHVSNLYIMKFINGTPFHIVGGPKRGVISEPKMVGLEYYFLQRDRENLEPFGLNPIIKKRGIGYMIYANQMAYQKTRSAFNNLHVRDLLITIEEAIEDLLGNYIFDFNNPINRIEIKTRVESYLDRIKSQQGIYTYEVVMNEQNNTDEVIQQNTAILDIALEPQAGMHKFINRIHVYGAGGIASKGFSVAV